MGRGMTSSEWLLYLGSDDAHRRLLEEAGSLALAAWQLARVRCAAGPVATEVPNRLELRGAAREIARRVGLPSEVPPGRALASECEAAGLPVV